MKKTFTNVTVTDFNTKTQRQARRTEFPSSDMPGPSMGVCPGGREKAGGGGKGGRRGDEKERNGRREGRGGESRGRNRKGRGGEGKMEKVAEKEKTVEDADTVALG